MKHILLIEDLLEYQILASSVLSPIYKITTACNIEKAREQLKAVKFDLIILDVVLPDGNGFNFCAEIRADPKMRDIPVIFMTMKSDLMDKLFGFSLGADDYIIKPFEALLLKARVEARLRNIHKGNQVKDVIQAGVILINLVTLKAFIVADNKTIHLDLTPIEFKLLSYFVKNEDRIITREQLLDAVWGTNTHVFDRATDKHISSLRQKMMQYNWYILTKSGLGYQFLTRKE